VKWSGPAAPEVTLVVPRPRERRAATQLYLERATLVEMTERPLLVMSRPLPADQTQIVRRPLRKPRGRRWIFIFGGAATATLLAAWLGFGHHSRTSQAATLTLSLAAPPSTVVPNRDTPATARPIVAPLAALPPTFAATAPSSAMPPVVSSRRSPRAASASLASGRHAKTAPARIASSSRLAAHRAPAHVTRPAATVAWVDPFIDR